MTPLGVLLRELIREEGPIGLDRYMALALGHPRHGYYMTRDPLGASGDFTTAPEISQTFGELIGAWCATVHAAMGAPAPFRLVELGPGRGTLLADLLRAAALAPGFRAAIDLHLVETSPVLRARQAATLDSTGLAPTWHADLDTVPPGPALVVANEFFDALPVRHYLRAADGWHERLVGLDASGGLCFGMAPAPEPGLAVPAAPGAVLEVGIAAQALARRLAGRFARDGGAALVIDYGYTRSRPGETLQALRAHAPADPLAAPGEADLTAHVDFAALSRAARAGGAAVAGPVTQGAFLRALGIGMRTERLAARHPARAPELHATLRRLTGPSPGMGELFKVLAFGNLAPSALPGFNQ